MITRITRNWWALVGRGLAAVCLGITAFVWPEFTQSALVYVFGAFSLAHGFLSLAYSFSAEPDFRWLFAIEGFVAIAGGIVAFVWPEFTGQAMLYLIAGWAVAIGSLQLTESIWMRKAIDNEWLLTISGLASLAFGVLLVIAPSVGDRAVIYLIGAYALVFGALDIFLGLRLRSIYERLGVSSRAEIG